jgi:hypothetical protein
MRRLVTVTLFNAESENDFTLFEENGKYFVGFANRTGTYQEFVRMLIDDDALYRDLLDGDVRENFFTLMKLIAERWKDQISARVFPDKGS